MGNKGEQNLLPAIRAAGTIISNKKGEPYLETHNIVWLSQCGEDSVENTVGLCPNCQRKMHALGDRKYVAFLLAKKEQLH